MSVKPQRIAVVMDPIEDIKPRKDTTLAMLLATVAGAAGGRVRPAAHPVAEGAVG